MGLGHRSRIWGDKSSTASLYPSASDQAALGFTDWDRSTAGCLGSTARILHEMTVWGIRPGRCGVNGSNLVSGGRRAREFCSQTTAFAQGQRLDEPRQWKAWLWLFSSRPSAVGLVGLISATGYIATSSTGDLHSANLYRIKRIHLQELQKP